MPIISHEDETGIGDPATKILQMTWLNRLRRWLQRPRWLRLQRNVDTTRREVKFLADRVNGFDAPWKTAADGALDRAEQCLLDLDLGGGWSAVHAAQRFAVFGMTEEELEDRRIALLEEARSGKLKAWRSNSIIVTINGNIEQITPAKQITPEALADAMSIRDESSDTEYCKIEITGQQINVLLRNCLLSGLLFLAYVAVSIRLGHSSFTGLVGVPNPWNHLRLATVLLLGLLGAALSTLRGLIGTDTARSLPGWIANRSITIGRLLSGVIAGLAGYIFWVEGVVPFDPNRVAWLFSIPFIFGYLGERLVMQFAQVLSKDKSDKS